jgi:hypothetical protein
MLPADTRFLPSVGMTTLEAQPQSKRPYPVPVASWNPRCQRIHHGSQLLCHWIYRHEINDAMVCVFILLEQGGAWIPELWRLAAGNSLDLCYGETVIVAALLVMLPMEAVTVTCPPVLRPATPETRPADTVARFVLLEVHVATEVTSGDPLQVVASALSCTVVPELLLTLPLVGVSVILLMQPTVTVTVCVPVMVGFSFEVAVTVAVPTLADVTRPLAEIVAIDGESMVQATDGLLEVLPSLFVPNAVICTVLFVFPVSIVGFAGPTASELNVGFTKNPLQPTAKASVASTPNAPIKRRLDLFDDITV